MAELREHHIANGAKVADDGIPLYYTDLLTEYRAALDAAVLLDRSHEGRIEIVGSDRAALLQRLSTNDLLNVALGEGRPTIFTTNTARILHRALVYGHQDDKLLLVSSPGQGGALFQYLQRNIFFRDDVRLNDLSATTRQFSLHGSDANSVIEALVPNASDLNALCGTSATIAGVPVFLARRKSYSGTHWLIVTPAEQAVAVWQTVLEAGKKHSLIAAGSLTFNTLRIRAGRPGVGRELTEEHLPLELGLWDEISFTKGCYTGQEIIARMESRSRLAKTIVTLNLSHLVNAPADLLYESKRVGTLTSSVTAPDGEVFGIGVVKPSLAVVGQTLNLSENVATVTGLPGIQPPMLTEHVVEETA